MPKRGSELLSDHDAVHTGEYLGDHKSLHKRNKTAVKAEKAPTAGVTDQKHDDNGDAYWDINANGTRRVTVSKFKGQTMINIREYYEKEGNMLPGKKGISLVLDQFSALIEALPQIDAIISATGVHIPRPVYDRANDGGVDSQGLISVRGEDQEADAASISRKTRTKANYEDTSDEESAVD